MKFASGEKKESREVIEVRFANKEIAGCVMIYFPNTSLAMVASCMLDVPS